MKRAFTIVMIMLGFYAKAQVVLEHSYSSNWQMEVVNIEGDGYKYLGVDTLTKDIKIYNTDHSLWKTIHTSIPQTASMYVLNSYASKYLFNNDNKIEVLVMYYVSTPSLLFKVELYNEDGVALNTFNNAAWYNIAEVDGNWKLLVRFNNTTPQHTEVYALPGQWTGVAIAGKEPMTSGIYPNPLEQTATISYTLPENISQGVLNIYNETGVLVRSYAVTRQFDNIMINKGDLPAGVYLYDITTAGGRQAGKRFVIR